MKIQPAWTPIVLTEAVSTQKGKNEGGGGGKNHYEAFQKKAEETQSAEDPKDHEEPAPLGEAPPAVPGLTVRTAEQRLSSLDFLELKEMLSQKGIARDSRSPNSAPKPPRLALIKKSPI